MRNLVLIVVTLFCVSIAGTLVYALFYLNSPIGQEQEITYDVPPGQTFNAVIADLSNKGVIEKPLLFKVLLKLKSSANKLKVGEYAINGSYTPGKLLQVLTAGESIKYSMTFKEGINMYEIAEILEQRGLGSREKFLKLCRDADFIRSQLGQAHYSLEGYLFPETYIVTKYTTEEELIGLMVSNFKRVFAEVLANNPDLGLTPHEIVTLASVIEKETGIGGERGLVSSVFHNRLKKGMRLESDPTIIYGILDETGSLIENIRRKDIRAPTKFNTYTVKALPLGPISNPGREALVATLNPETSEYLFFVSRNDGTHYFSKTYKEHLQAVRRFQLDAKAREGKSWRDALNK